MRWLWRHQLERTRLQLAGLVILAALLYLSAAVGLSYVAGFSTVQDRLVQAAWPWLFAALGAVLLAFPAYYLTYRGTGRMAEGASLEPSARVAVVAFGFGEFLARSGSAVDRLAAEGAGASTRQARVRVAFLEVTEHAVLAVPGCVAAIALLIEGPKKPPEDFLFPWAIGPVVGLTLALWAAGRYRGRWRDESGWRGSLSVATDAIYLLRRAASNPLRHADALGGMLLYWLLEMFALWAALRMFHFHMNFGSTVVAFGTAMIVTRRMGPFGGAGLLDVALPPTLWLSGAPLSAAILGTFVYRFFSLWFPLPFALASRPRVRAIVEGAGKRGDSAGTKGTAEPALQR